MLSVSFISTQVQAAECLILVLGVDVVPQAEHNQYAEQGNEVVNRLLPPDLTSILNKATAIPSKIHEAEKHKYIDKKAEVVAEVVNTGVEEGADGGRVSEIEVAKKPALVEVAVSTR